MINYLVFNVRGNDSGIFQAVSPADAISEMLTDAGVAYSVVLDAGLVDCGDMGMVSAFDVLVYDSKADRDADTDNTLAASRATHAAVEVVAIRGSRADVLREIEALLGSNGSPELADAVEYLGGSSVCGAWYVTDWAATVAKAAEVAAESA